MVCEWTLTFANNPHIRFVFYVNMSNRWLSNHTVLVKNTVSHSTLVHHIMIGSLIAELIANSSCRIWIQIPTNLVTWHLVWILSFVSNWWWPALLYNTLHCYWLTLSLGRLRTCVWLLLLTSGRFGRPQCGSQHKGNCGPLQILHTRLSYIFLKPDASFEKSWKRIELYNTWAMTR